MTRKNQTPLTPAQLQIMNLFWDHGELGVAQVWQHLSDQRSVARNTVQTMLMRLAERGWLRVRGEGNAFYYRAAQPRARAQNGMLGDLLDGAFGGSASGLVMNLLESGRLTPDEARRIRDLIDRSRQNEKRQEEK